MNTKLTLVLKKELVESAEKYAGDKGESLSELIENYFKFITVPRKKISENNLSPKVRELRGIIPAKDNSDYKQILVEELMKKHDI